jgi:hypothetical protein
MNARLWLCCGVCVSCAGAQYERPAPGEFAGPPVVRAPDRSPDAGAPQPEPTTPPGRDAVTVLTPEPNTSIEPSESQSVCEAAIAASRAASGQPGPAVAQPGAPPGLRPEQIRRTTLRNLSQLTECQERALAVDSYV